MVRVFTITALSGALLGACVATPDLDIASAPSGAYQLDPEHASVVFRVGHLNGVSRYVARFDEFDAALDFDPANPAASRLEATLETASLNTGDPEFDAQLIGLSNLFASERFPQVRFVSTGVAMTGANTAEVTGDLTFRSVTLPVTLDTTFNGSAPDPLRGADVIGFSARAIVSRGAFGADAYSNFGVGDEVEVLIEAEFLQD